MVKQTRSRKGVAEVLGPRHKAIRDFAMTFLAICQRTPFASVLLASAQMPKRERGQSENRARAATRQDVRPSLESRRTENLTRYLHQ